jgi:ribokinase
LGWDDKHVLRQEAFPVSALDTTGAGDVYHGAYIYGLLQGWDMQQCMRFASAAAAMKCRVLGTEKGIPNAEDIQRLLEAVS